MKALVEHLVRNNMDEILQKSFINCHCKGVHSIMLLDSPGKEIRIYIATKDHELYKNFPGGSFVADKMSIGFHSHHCNLTLKCVYGNVYNVAISREPGGLHLKSFTYNSEITNGKIGFKKAGLVKCVLDLKKCIDLCEGDSLALEASDIHSVAVEKGKVSAWFVFSGLEDPNYEALTISNRDLDEDTFDDYT